MKQYLFLTFFLLFLISNQLIAQTPPERSWYFNNQGQKTSIKERWNENSQGQKNGTYIKYFENGEREILGYYKNDIPNGKWEITVFTNLLFQQVKSITYVNFLNGQEHGLYKTVSGNTILIQGSYNNGVKTGYWKEDYDIEDKIYSEGNYVNGKRDGEWKNTSVVLKSKDEMGLGILTGDVNSVKIETKKDYKTIYKNGEVIAVYDDKGINLLEKQKQEDAQRLEDEEFKKCSTISDFENFRKKYPYSEFDSDAIIQISKLKRKAEDEAIAKKKQEEEKAYIEPLINKWNSIQDKASVVNTFWSEYFNKYPNGVYSDKVKKAISATETYIQQTKDICECDYNNLNQITSTQGSLPFSYSIVMEIKQKFGIDIFRYMNYAGTYQESFSFIEEYPNLKPNTDIQHLKYINNGMKDKKLSYKIQNGKLSEIKISNEEEINMRGDKIIYKTEFFFDKEGRINEFIDSKHNTYTYQGYKNKLKFDESGKLVKHNCNSEIKIEMFQ